MASIRRSALEAPRGVSGPVRIVVAVVFVSAGGRCTRRPPSGISNGLLDDVDGQIDLLLQRLARLRWALVQAPGRFRCPVLFERPRCDSCKRSALSMIHRCKVIRRTRRPRPMLRAMSDRPAKFRSTGEGKYLRADPYRRPTTIAGSLPPRCK
jgi:hypothetical protein